MVTLLFAWKMAAVLLTLCLVIGGTPWALYKERRILLAVCGNICATVLLAFILAVSLVGDPDANTPSLPAASLPAGGAVVQKASGTSGLLSSISWLDESDRLALFVFSLCYGMWSTLALLFLPKLLWICGCKRDQGRKRVDYEPGEEMQVTITSWSRDSADAHSSAYSRLEEAPGPATALAPPSYLRSYLEKAPQPIAQHASALSDPADLEAAALQEEQAKKPAAGMAFVLVDHDHRDGSSNSRAAAATEAVEEKKTLTSGVDSSAAAAALRSSLPHVIVDDEEEEEPLDSNVLRDLHDSSPYVLQLAKERQAACRRVEKLWRTQAKAERRLREKEEQLKKRMERLYGAELSADNKQPEEEPSE